MELKAKESCLEPSTFDIVVGGQRYGYVFRESYFNWVKRRDCVRWKARMNWPHLLDLPPMFGERYEVADTMGEAILLAFEEFSKSDDDKLDEYARIAAALFVGADVPADILAAI